MSSCPHTAFPKNTKVFIILKNGEKFIDNFIGKKSKYVFFKELGKVNIGDIKVISYFKNQPQSNRSTS